MSGMAGANPRDRGFKARRVVALILNGSVKGLWVFAVLLWPFLKWVFSIEVFVRLLMMLYHWNEPASHAGWTFALHFLGLAAMTYFVGCYKPKGI